MSYSPETVADAARRQAVWAKIAAIEMLAKSLYDDEQESTRRIAIDKSPTWMQISRSDREEYRKVAATLIEESKND